MANCSSRKKGETEQEYRKRCGGYTYAFPIDLVQKEEPPKEEEPTASEPPAPEPPAPEGDVSEARHTKGNIYKGKLKVDGNPVQVEVELVGVDNRTRSYLVRVIHIDRKYLSYLPKTGIIPIPARIFDIPGGGWVKVKTQGQFEGKQKDIFPGGMADKYSLEGLAKKHGVGVDEIKSQIAKGVKVEMEHTNDKKVAFEIAKDHVFENPKYYDKLKTIENRIYELLKKKLSEDWTNKYKKSIDCNNPKGFSQKAHCAGRKARERGEKTKSNSVK
jgi:hypothetical protein